MPTFWTLDYYPWGPFLVGCYGTMGGADDVAPISLELLNHFPWFFAHFVGPIKTILLTPWSLRSIHSFPRYCHARFRQSSDLFQMCSATVPPDLGLNRRLLATPFHLPYSRISVSTHSWDIRFFVIIICHSSPPFSVLYTPLVLVKPHCPSCSVHPHVLLSPEHYLESSLPCRNFIGVFTRVY